MYRRLPFKYPRKTHARMPLAQLGLCLVILLGIDAGSKAGPYVIFREVATGLSPLTGLANAGDGSGRLFVLEQKGTIRIIRDGQLVDEPFLDIGDRLDLTGEGGLVGLAFHPGYAQNGRFFISYLSRPAGAFKLVIGEYTVDSQNPDRAVDSEKPVLSIDQPTPIHQGGDLAFGPDGYLYISAGDGGPQGDPGNRAQSLSTLLGKILRIDVSGETEPYGIPADNPFVGQDDVKEEIWAYGFRNPYRFGFDRETGRLFTGDVGDADFEEVDIVVPGGNFGWNRLEGPACFPPEVQECDSEGLVAPIHSYGRSDGGAVIGGRVYRGRQPTPLLGSYIFGDFISGRVWALTEDRGVWKRTQLGNLFRPVAFAEDEDGEIYIADTGQVLRIEFLWLEVLPLLTDGTATDAALRSRVLIANKAGVDVTGELLFLDDDGELTEVPGEGGGFSVRPFEIGPESTLSLDTAGTSNPLFSGWAAVLSGRPLEAAAILELLQAPPRSPAEPRLEESDGGTLIQTSLESSLEGTGFLAHVSRDSALGTDVAVALVNPNLTEESDLVLTLTTSEGTELLRWEATLDPLHRKSFFLHEIKELPDDYDGTLRIEASRAVSPAVLSTIRGVQSTSIPLVRLPD